MTARLMRETHTISTYDVKGEKSEETVKENTSPLNIPDLTNYGYIFKGMASK